MATRQKASVRRVRPKTEKKSGQLRGAKKSAKSQLKTSSQKTQVATATKSTSKRPTVKRRTKKQQTASARNAGNRASGNRASGNRATGNRATGKRVTGKRRLGIRDRLGRLTYRAACRLLDPQDGEQKLRHGARFEIDLARDVFLGGDTLRVNVPDLELPTGTATVIITEMTNKPKGLHLTCTHCQTAACDHVAAVLSLVLDEKLALGLAAPPDENEPIELLTENELLQRAIADREQRAATERMTLKSLDDSTPWTDYTVTSRESGKTYRISLHGFENGQSFCTCPDFRTNRLGTCKHVINCADQSPQAVSPEELAKPPRNTVISLRVDYGEEVRLTFNLPENLPENAKQIVGELGSTRDRGRR